MEQPLTHADSILRFYQELKPDFPMPKDFGILDAFSDPSAWKLTTRFYEKFYGDNGSRTLIFGINPGRFGGGITGIPFTDPIRLQERCGIPNDLKKLPELSSGFIYQLIDAFGGVKSFYNRFFITALSPLGFIKAGKNMNYYDDRSLLLSIEPFIVECIRKQIAIFKSPAFCFCLGEGENYKQFMRINAKHYFFEEIIPLPHPRWIMQYRRKKVDDYVKMYVDSLSSFRIPASRNEH